MTCPRFPTEGLPADEIRPWRNCVMDLDYTKATSYHFESGNEELARRGHGCRGNGVGRNGSIPRRSRRSPPSRTTSVGAALNLHGGGPEAVRNGDQRRYRVLHAGGARRP